MPSWMRSQKVAGIAARRDVWTALSSLFLNTDPSHTPTSRTALLAASPYSLVELEQILIYEVYPVCTYNMLSVAGAWAGFSGVATAAARGGVGHNRSRGARGRFLRAGT